jgi:hypothetical protein
LKCSNFAAGLEAQWTVRFTEYLLGHHINDREMEMDVACGTYWGQEKYVQNFDTDIEGGPL